MLRNLTILSCFGLAAVIYFCCVESASAQYYYAQPAVGGVRVNVGRVSVGVASPGYYDYAVPYSGYYYPPGPPAVIVAPGYHHRPHHYYGPPPPPPRHHGPYGGPYHHGPRHHRGPYRF